MSSRKRKHPKNSGVTRPDQNSDPYSNSHSVPERDTNPGPGLYVQAYEADIVRGLAAKIAAASLEAPLAGTIETGGALIRWGSQRQPTFPQGEDILSTQAADDQHVVWVDRYDARLLLDTLPTPNTSRTLQDIPDSPGGWSDLPSDTEDMFFLDPEEIEDYRRDKKRRHLEQLRAERLKARRKQDGESSDEEEVWGGSDEEPNDVQRYLMQRTANHLLSSPNPTQLEARILANHGSDIRFAFLRGRWRNVWRTIKSKAKMAKEKENEKESTSGLGGLAGYGSDADSAEDEAEAQYVAPQTTALPDSTSQVSGAEAAI